MAALLLSACSQDELGGQGTTLPEGEYPLQIGGVSISAEASEQSWTRVSENTDGMGSVFQRGDAIGVRLGNETATYTYDGSTWTSDYPLYWQSTQPATVTAWYPVEAEIYFNQQDKNGLAYLLLGGAEQVTYNTPANLTFTHQLAKVRVKLEGTKANDVKNVYVKSYSFSTHFRGELDPQLANPDKNYVPMWQTTDGNETCWEATLYPETLAAENSFAVATDGGNPVPVTLTDDITLTAGQVHTININVKSVVPDDAQPVTGDINGSGNYVVSDSRTDPINITGGNPTIYLDGATVSVNSGNAISITGNATPTIHVLGKGNTVSANEGAGIYVAENSTMTIKGNGLEDELIVEGHNGSAGIGCYSTSDGTNYSCGNITISNVTLTARSEGDPKERTVYAAGIGSAGTSTVGSISISDATIYAYGAGSTASGAAAIGSGYDGIYINGNQTEFDITISNSTIYASRGCSYASYIGAGGGRNNPIGYNIISTALITGSHIYDGNGNEITQ